MSTEPQFGFCTSADGTRIAYATYGKGPPLLSLVINIGVDAALTIPESRAFYDALAARVTLGIYDLRGTGASGRSVADYSDRAQESDIAAVADALAWEEFSLFANNLPILPYGQYARAQPKRVTRLIWWNTFFATMVRAGIGGEHDRAARAGGAEFSNLRRRAVSLYFPDGPVRLQREYGLAWKTVTSREASERAHDEWIKSNLVDEFLPAITTRALVLARSGLTPERPTVMRLAGLLPNSDLRFVAGNSGEPFPDHEPVVEAIAEFMGVGARPAARESNAALRTILFTDLVGHTEMMRRLGDERGRDVLREHERITRNLLKQHGGAEVKTMGDGFMASFASVTRAMDCAIALQRAFNAAPPPDSHLPLPIRIGLNAGEPIEEDGDLFGSTVIMASRIAAKAGAGEILIPEPLRHLLTGKSYVYADRGETILKGFEDAVRLYEVRWRE